MNEQAERSAPWFCPGCNCFNARKNPKCVQCGHAPPGEHSGFPAFHVTLDDIAWAHEQDGESVIGATIRTAISERKDIEQKVKILRDAIFYAIKLQRVDGNVRVHFDAALIASGGLAEEK